MSSRPSSAPTRETRSAHYEGTADHIDRNIGIVWRGDREARRAATPQNNRFHRVFEELAALGIQAEPAVYDEDIRRRGARAAPGRRRRAGLGRSDPQGKTRAALDALLRDVAARGPWVSAHPDVILKMGVKEVLIARGISAGAPTRISIARRRRFAMHFPPRLRSAGPRVLKQNRGNGGQGVWKVELVSDRRRAQRRARAACAARQRAGGHAAGGFHGALRAVFRRRRLHRRSAVSAAPARRHDPLLHGRRQGRRLRAPVHQGADPAAARRARIPRPRSPVRASCTAPTRRRFRRSGEDGNRVDAADDAGCSGIDAASLPIIWDADFLYGPRTASGEDTYVLCEINVSSCSRSRTRRRRRLPSWSWRDAAKPMPIKLRPPRGGHDEEHCYC